MRILLVRTSSMGDLVHTLPAVSDIARQHPGAVIDWVAEEAFASIPTWHHAVDRVIPVAIRRWRKAWFSAEVRRERARFRAQLREYQYDAVLDTQGLIKSAALVAWPARGPSHGLDRRSAREPLASLFYRHRHAVAPMQPAVLRYRLLAAQALGHTLLGPPDFALGHLCRSPGGLTDADGRLLLDRDEVGVPVPTVAIMPGASRDPKLWPEADWIAVLQRLVMTGHTPLVLAGNAEEQARARRLAEGAPGTRLVPRLSLEDTAALLSQVRFMVGLDSGLTHLAAALGRPCIGIYCATPVIRTPLTGAAPCESLGDKGSPPSRAQVLATLERFLAAPAV